MGEIALKVAGIVLVAAVWFALGWLHGRRSLRAKWDSIVGPREPSLLAQVKRTNPDGGIARIAEELERRHPILHDHMTASEVIQRRGFE